MSRKNRKILAWAMMSPFILLFIGMTIVAIVVSGIAPQILGIFVFGILFICGVGILADVS